MPQSPRHNSTPVERVEELKHSFQDFITKGNDCGKGRHRECKHKIVKIRAANPGATLFAGFCRGNYRKRYQMAMGIMYHGSHRDNIRSICRNGIHEGSYYTSSFHYAVRRSEYKEGYISREVEVLAMAVLVDGKHNLSMKDSTLQNRPDREYALPLFIVTVRVE